MPASPPPPDFRHSLALRRLAPLLLLAAALAAMMVLADGKPTPVMAQEPSSATDRAALVALYNATGGPNWENCYYYPCKPTANWLSDKPIGEWSGVTTNADGRVTSLSLPGYRMKGQLPAELGNLSELGYLMLSGNQLTGSIPSELGKLTNLWYLNLINAGLSGSIPPELGNLTELWSLKLQSNRLTGSIPSELGNLTSLGYLRLGANKLTGSIPGELGNIPELYRLELHKNQLSGSIPAELGNLATLDKLDFSRNNLSGSIPAELGNLTRLKELNLRRNWLTGSVPAEVRNIPTLQTLSLQYNRLDDIPDQFPAVASPLADISDLQEGDSRSITLEGVFSDGDGDRLSITAFSNSFKVVSVKVGADWTNLTVTGLAPGTAAITVTAQDSDYNRVSDRFDVTVVPPPNNAPILSSAISDATIVNESGTYLVSLPGVFSDADGDDLTVSAKTSAAGVAAVSVAADYSWLTITAKSRGSATITVTADDGEGGSVEDSFTVRVKAAPVVASAISDIGELKVGARYMISLADVFNDPDGDTLRFSVGQNNGVVSIQTWSSLEPDVLVRDSATGDLIAFTVIAKAEGTSTITVFVQDSDGNTVSDAFDVTVIKANNAPTVSSGIDDVTITNESGTSQVSLSGVFSDTDQDSLTITASSSDEKAATVSVSADYATLTVSAKARGSATITVTAADGNGGSVDDTFTVTVKAAPVVVNAIADVGGLEVDDTQKISLSGAFSDADVDSLTITAGSSKDAVATVSVAADHANLTLTGKAAGTATITVSAQDSDGNRVSDAFDVTVIKANKAPTVSSGIDDATIVNQSGTSQVSLSGVFADADQDSLTITASSSNEAVATASVSADYATLTVSAKARGTATITVAAADGNGGLVEDSFTVTVKAAPVVANAIADVSELEIDATHEVSMSGVFSDADGDALIISATTSDTAVVQVSNTIDPSTGSATAVTVIGVDAGTATVTVTARDSDGNSVSDAFDVTVPAAQQQAVELPGPVVSLEVTASAENRVTVSWSAPETGGAPDGYIVHLKPENGERGSGKTKRPKAKKTQVKFNNLESGRTYQVWVRAENEAGKGERVHASITLPE